MHATIAPVIPLTNRTCSLPPVHGTCLHNWPLDQGVEAAASDGTVQLMRAESRSSKNGYRIPLSMTLSDSVRFCEALQSWGPLQLP